MANPPSRLPPRSVLLLRRGVRRTPAPLLEGAEGLYESIKVKRDVIILMSVNGGFYLLYYSGAGRETL